MTMTWKIPLSDEEFATIGKITVTLSMIEVCVDHLLILASGSMTHFRQRILTGGTSIGNKLIALRKLSDYAIPEPACSLIKNACTAANAELKSRNQVIHGQWGTYVDNGSEQVGTFSWKYPESTFTRGELPGLLDRLNEVSILFMNAGDALHGTESAPPYSFRFSPQIPNLPSDEEKKRDLLARINALG